MSSYPVAYRSSARAQGFQTGPSLAFLDTSKVRELEGAAASRPTTGYGPSSGGIEYGLTGAGIIGIVSQWLRTDPSVPEDDSAFPDRVWPEEINEDWHGADWPDRGQFEDEEAPAQAGTLVPPFVGYVFAGSCTLDNRWTTGPVWSSAVQTLCSQTTNWPAVLAAQCIGLSVAQALRYWTRGVPTAAPDMRYNRVTTGAKFYPYARYVPAPAPQVGAIELPDGDLDDPFYDSPWDLPLKNPGQVRPRPIWWPTRTIPKPVVRTWPVVFPQPVFTPGPGVIVIVDEDGGVTTEPGPAPAPAPAPGPGTGGSVSTGVPFPSPPGAREREGKQRGKSAFFLKAMFNIVTEFGDFVDALWKALPKEARRKCMKNGKRKKCSTFDKIMQLGDALYDGHMADAAYWKEAFIQLATNEIIDQFYGRAGRLYAKANAAFGFPQGRGFQTGGWLRRGGAPKSIGGESVSEFVEGYVRKAVNQFAP